MSSSDADFALRKVIGEPTDQIHELKALLSAKWRNAIWAIVSSDSDLQIERDDGSVAWRSGADALESAIFEIVATVLLEQSPVRHNLTTTPPRKTSADDQSELSETPSDEELKATQPLADGEPVLPITTREKFLQVIALMLKEKLIRMPGEETDGMNITLPVGESLTIRVKTGKALEQEEGRA